MKATLAAVECWLESSPGPAICMFMFSSPSVDRSLESFQVEEGEKDLLENRVELIEIWTV